MIRVARVKDNPCRRYLSIEGNIKLINKRQVREKTTIAIRVIKLMTAIQFFCSNKERKNPLANIKIRHTGKNKGSIKKNKGP